MTNKTLFPSQQEMEESRIRTRKEKEFLDKHVFYGLKDINTGFDVVSIRYFSEDDFGIALERIKELGISVMGIEPWLDGDFYDVKTFEEVTDNSSDPAWYMKAFEDFKARGIALQYAASYSVPDNLLDEEE